MPTLQAVCGGQSHLETVLKTSWPIINGRVNFPKQICLLGTVVIKFHFAQETSKVEINENMMGVSILQSFLEMKFLNPFLSSVKDLSKN